MLLPRHTLMTCAQKTASGIFLPTSATNNPLPEATVIAVGPGAPNKDGQVVPTQVKPGDRVLLPGWGGNSIKVGEEVCIPTNLFCIFPLLTSTTCLQEYFLFRDNEILAKIQE